MNACVIDFADTQGRFVGRNLVRGSMLKTDGDGTETNPADHAPSSEARNGRQRTFSS